MDNLRFESTFFSPWPLQWLLCPEMDGGIGVYCLLSLTLRCESVVCVCVLKPTASDNFRLDSPALRC